MATRKLSLELPNVTSPTFTGTVIEPGFILGSTAVVATGTEMNYLSGVTSNIQTQISAKLASATYTAADVLAKMLTVDGAGSGLDADTLDGAQGALYARLASPTFTGTLTANIILAATIRATGEITAYYV
jgi:hypothetical protein